MVRRVAMDTFNIELLITLIEERPVIWDKTLDIYKNKVLRETAWREICVILKEDFEHMDKNERQKIGKAVLKKWTQIRDSWGKDIKKKKDQKKSGSSASTYYKPYKYSEQLSFLKKIFDTTMGEERGQTNEDVEEGVSHIEKGNENATSANVENRSRENNTKERSIEISNNESKGTHSLKRKQNDIDSKMIKFLDSVHTNIQKEEDPHLHFFKGLLPITSTLNTDETLQFQAGVINLLQNIKRQRQISHYQNIGYTTTHFQNTEYSTSVSPVSPSYQSPPPASDVQLPASNLVKSEDTLEFSNF